MAKPYMEVAVGGMYVEIICSSTPDSQHEGQVVWLTTYFPFLTFTLPPSLGVNLMIFSCSNAALFGHKLEFESSLCGAGGGDFSRTSLAEQFTGALVRKRRRNIGEDAGRSPTRTTILESILACSY